MPQKKGNEYPKQGGCQHTPLLNSTTDFEVVRGGTIKLDGTWHVDVERLENVEMFWWAPYPVNHLEEAAPAHRVESFREVTEGYIKWFSLLSAHN